MATSRQPQACNGVTISGSATHGDDPSPLYEAGSADISCVIRIEALAQIQVSKTVLNGQSGGWKDATFGGVTISDPIFKYTITAQSGQAYYVDTISAFGKVS